MPSKQFICGQPDSPVAGQTVFVHPFLQNVQINFLLVNNVPENQLNPSPDFTHSYIESKITRSNVWQLGDKLIIDYTNCSNK